MQTREELITGLKEAIRLMNLATQLKNSSITTNQQQVCIKQKKAEITGNKKVLFQIAAGIVSWLILKAVFGKIGTALLVSYGSTAWMPLGVKFIYYIVLRVIPIIIAVFIAVNSSRIIKKKNEEILKYNEKIVVENESIHSHNKSVQAKVEEINCRLKEIQEEYRNNIATWYPPKYCYIEAAEFFLDAAVNCRADTIKEAVNLYETTLHQQRPANKSQAQK